ncbi:hypothetical protein DFH94DRAFT_849739 [Russula ochroleuca]|uniref:F-box domain-containing protein n=1 Tax=Russula ochroleuca TaxID=152965 RepID=A0A9P5N754_9AGAM|nr:hypothetical protein DFH94DRAFT_849739 [Russula ochroleuca]
MPVTTRRQLMGLSHPNAISERGPTEDTLPRTMQESDDDDDPMDGSFAVLSSSEEDEDHEPVRDEPESGASEEALDHEESDLLEVDDDYEVSPPKAKRIKLGKVKRATSSKSPAKAKRTGVSRRIRGRLQNMLSLSFDVLFLIFSELGPMDLVNLARTSKALRQVLTSRKSMWVWIVARRNAGPIMVPDPPEDMSEPAWALLLFGPAVCSHCSTKNVHRIDFALRRRLCTICRKRNLVHSIRFRFRCPDLKESVMDLLPYTKIGGWAEGRASSGRFYWKPDLYDMTNKLAELEEDRNAGKAGAQERLKLFRAERILFVDSIIQSCPEFEKWAKEEAEAQAHISQERRAQRREALKDRILSAGYVSADIDYIGMSAVPGANVDKILTEKAWRRIRRKVESRLSSARERRLQERCRREIEYKTKAEQCYSDILRQVLPVQRSYLPAVSQACELSCFRELLNPDRVVLLTEWADATGQLRESLSEWMSLHRDKYTSLLPLNPYGGQVKAMEVKLLSDPSIEAWHRAGTHDFAGKLELATSVFRHPDTNTIHIGRDVCHAWKMKGELEFSERGAEAVHSLLQELHLDPETTTPSMLEQLDRCFVCACCPADLQRIHRSWRSCVFHFVDCSETDHPYPRWRVVSPLVSPDDEARRGSPFDYCHPHQPETWLCNHCSDFPSHGPSPSLVGTSEDGMQEHAHRHVQAVHNIDRPLVDVDLFLYPDLGIDRPYCKPRHTILT